MSSGSFRGSLPQLQPLHYSSIYWLTIWLQTFMNVQLYVQFNSRYIQNNPTHHQSFLRREKKVSQRPVNQSCETESECLSLERTSIIWLIRRVVKGGRGQAFGGSQVGEGGLEVFQQKMLSMTKVDQKMLSNQRLGKVEQKMLSNPTATPTSQIGDQSGHWAKDVRTPQRRHLSQEKVQVDIDCQ